MYWSIYGSGFYNDSTFIRSRRGYGPGSAGGQKLPKKSKEGVQAIGDMGATTGLAR